MFINIEILQSHLELIWCFKRGIFRKLICCCVSIGNPSTSYVSTERLTFEGSSKRSIDFLEVFSPEVLFVHRRFDLIKNGGVNYLFLSERSFFVYVLRSVNDLLILPAFC